MNIQPSVNQNSPQREPLNTPSVSPGGKARFRRDLGAIAIGLLIASFTMSARADITDLDSDTATDAPTAQERLDERIATSRGVAGNPRSSTGKFVTGNDPVTSKPRQADAANTSAPSSAKSGLFSDFEIFDADVTLYFDDDLDGHYYGIDVNFDADTDYALADVYARLYLSLEGGPWELYYTTEIFTLIGDTGGDDYTVETELYSGYPTAYYDVLIELYDADTDEFVAEFGPADSIELDEVPLEDQQKDAGVFPSVPTPIVSHSHGGGGSASLLVLALLMLTLAARARRSRSTEHANS